MVKANQDLKMAISKNIKILKRILTELKSPVTELENLRKDFTSRTNGAEYRLLEH